MNRSLHELETVAFYKWSNVLRLAGVTGIWFIATLLCAAGVVWSDGSGLAVGLTSMSMGVTGVFALCTFLWFDDAQQASKRATSAAASAQDLRTAG